MRDWISENMVNHIRHRHARSPQPEAHPKPILDPLPPLPTITPDGLVPGLISGITNVVPPAVPSVLGLPTIPAVPVNPVNPDKKSTSTTSTMSTTSTTSTTSAAHTTTITSSTSISTSDTVTSNTPVPIVTKAPITRTNLVLQTISTTASTRPSTSSVALPSSGISGGVVVGGIGGAILGVIALILAIIFFLRRCRNHDSDDIADFDPKAFRRSAVVISDTPTHEDTIARGFNPRPPTMIERRLASPAPSFGTQYGAPGPAYNNEHMGGYSENRAGFGSHHSSYVPGQVMNYADSPSNPNHQMFVPVMHNQSPISPVHPPIPPQKEQYYNQQALATQSPMGVDVNGHPSQGGATYPVLTRQPSAQSSGGRFRRVPPSLALQKESVPANDYVDLNRSSVSPYQAAQYVEISKRLRTEVPQGLQGPIDRDLPPLPLNVSPFTDPESSPPSSGAQFAIDRRNLDPSPRPRSGESTSSATSNTLDFPVPPSPAYTVSSRYRADSNPTKPKLSEPNAELGSSMIRYSDLRNTAAVATGGLSVTNQKFPITSSPLASSFGIPVTPNVEETAPPPTPIAKKRTTTYSMYDAEEAYGGI